LLERGAIDITQGGDRLILNRAEVRPSPPAGTDDGQLQTFVEVAATHDRRGRNCSGHRRGRRNQKAAPVGAAPGPTICTAGWRSQRMICSLSISVTGERFHDQSSYRESDVDGRPGSDRKFNLG
jgi:hypothetical protein